MYQAGIFGQACRSNENISQHKIVALAAWAKQHEACPVTSSDLPSREQRGNALSQGQTKKTQPRKWRWGKPRMVQGLTAVISMLRSQQKNVKQTGLSLVQKTWCARVPLSFRLLSSLTKMDIRGIPNPWKLPAEPRSHQYVHDCPWYSFTLVPPTEKRRQMKKKTQGQGGYSSKSIKPRTHLLFSSVKREEWGGTSNTKREERNWETSSWKEDEGEEKDNDEISWKWTNLIEEDPRQERVWSRNSVRTFAEVLQRMSFISFGSGMNHWKFTTLEVPKKAPD